jgi:YesN/AraC family two-component response regulator
MDNNYQLSCIPNDICFFHNATTTDFVNQVLPYHKHDAYEIYLFLSGNTNFYLERVCYHLNPGDLIVISPDEMHRCMCLDNQLYERMGINIKRLVLERLSSPLTNLLTCFESHPLGQNNLVHLSDEQMEYFISLGDRLNKTLYSSEFGYDILSNSYLSEILVFINNIYQQSTYVGSNIMPKLVYDTMAFVEEHLTEDITLEQLSQRFRFNGAYISHIFKHHTGLTLRSYILEKRITLAKRLLSQGKNVSEACYMSGFMDYANFIRSFTKSVGISPGKYKQK